MMNCYSSQLSIEIPSVFEFLYPAGFKVQKGFSLGAAYTKFSLFFEKLTKQTAKCELLFDDKHWEVL